MELGHAGEIVADWLEENSMSQVQLSEEVDLSEKHVSRIVNGHVPLSLEVALAIEEVTGMKADLLVVTDARYRLQELRRRGGGER